MGQHLLKLHLYAMEHAQVKISLRMLQLVQTELEELSMVWLMKLTYMLISMNQKPERGPSHQPVIHNAPEGTEGPKGKTFTDATAHAAKPADAVPAAPGAPAAPAAPAAPVAPAAEAAPEAPKA